MKHIYNCEKLSEKSEYKSKQEKIYNGNIAEQIQIFQTFRINLEKKEIMVHEMNFPCDISEPLYTVIG